MNVTDDLKHKCPLCSGAGRREQISFRSAGEMDAGGEPQTHTISCYLCKGSGFVWALDQQQMAERIAKLEAENAALRQRVEALTNERNFAFEVLTRIGTAESIHEATSAILAARKETKQ
jgi:RecJ-like exonuclease